MVVRVGQTRATIYKTPSRGCPAYTVCWYEGETRRRKAFHDFEAAKLHASSTVNSLSRGESDILRLSGEQRLEYIRARQIISEFGISLDSAVSEYRDAKQLLKGASLLEAARHFATAKLIDLPTRTVSEVFREMLRSKREAGLSERYLQDLDSRLGEFSRDFQCSIAAVTGPEIRAWLQRKDVSNRTRNNSRVAIQTLFAFAIGQKYLPKEWNEMSAVPTWKAVGEEIEIFTPTEMSRLMSGAEKKMLPFLAMGGFAGLRSAEIQRLDWRDVDFKSGYVRVAAQQSKTGSRRLVPISENLRAWLLPLAKECGPVVELANIPNGIQRLIESLASVDTGGPAAKAKAGIKWKHNGLRHSYCSYRLAIVKSAAQVALEAGNSPKIIFEHYRELVTEQDALQWFEVMPVGGKEQCSASS